MEYTLENLEEYVRKEFSLDDFKYVMDILNMYGVEPGEPHRIRVQFAIVKLSECDVKRLLYYVERAKRDYRDVICEAENS